jgi:tetratricopeptide (TPR) repeat protein
MRLTRTVLLISGLAAPAGAALAQCPDGTPPPCRAATPARRPAPPPIDERTWIVLPFENIARAQDIDWLRDASVNLLYLDMSRWRDIRVIDDERVADFMREVPQGRGPLGLTQGMAVARRAGAGKLVMGDLLKVGNRTRVVAKVFDVRTGQRLRSVQEETSNPDSLMAVFGRLARGILNVAPPAGTTVGTIGTSSLAAYQEYLAGVQALNAFNLTAARQHFMRALALDSTFALAHYKMSVVVGWENPNAAERRRHAEAAGRHAAALPPRERTLIAGQVAQGGNRWAEACEAYHSLVRADSSDVEAWYNIGECEYHDNSLAAVQGDTARLMFRGNWNVALRAFRRTLELDPSYHLAFAHIPDILHADQRAGCMPPAGQNACSGPFLWQAVVIRRGDTIALNPVPASRGDDFASQYREAARLGTRRANYELARDIAQAWVQSGPAEPRARMALGRALLRLGDIEGADRELRLVTGARTGLERVQLAGDRVEIAQKLGNYDEAAAVQDTIERALDSLRVGQIGFQVAVTGIGMGRLARGDSVLRPIVPPGSRPFLAVGIRLMLGVPPDSTERVMAEFAAGPARAQGARPEDLYAQAAIWGSPFMRTWRSVPSLDTAARDPRVRAAAFILRGDTSGLRAALAAVDSFIVTAPVEMPENGLLLSAALGYLELRDSATALARLLDFKRRFPYLQPNERPVGGFVFGSMLWPRTFLLLGDIAAALGRNEEAVAAYRRAAGLWQSGDADVQPLVQRARAAAARLGG